MLIAFGYFVITYLVVGIILSLICYQDDKRLWKSNPARATAVAILWPVVLSYIIKNASYIKRKGEVIWRRK